MRIGVKYCGGCNPRYDRVAAVQALRDALPEAEFQFGSAACEAELLLAVCGCSAQCASLDPPNVGGQHVLWLDRVPDIPDLARYIRLVTAEKTIPETCDVPAIPHPAE